MSEEKKARTVEDCGREYGQLCQKAGHSYYQAKALERDLGLIFDQMLELNLEAAKLSLAAQAAAPAEAPKVEVVSE